MIIERQSIRGLVLTPDREVLLLAVRPPNRLPFWITPGGGLEPGETHEQGLRRELEEELGLRDFSLGPLIARRQHAFDWGAKRIHQREEIYLVEHPRFEPHMSDPVEAETVTGFRWWPHAELEHTEERITPAALWQILRRYFERGPLAFGELVVEVQVD